VQPRPGFGGQNGVPGDDGFLCNTQPRRKPGGFRCGPGIDLAVPGEIPALGMLGHDTAQPGGLQKCLTGECRIVDALAVVGKHPRPCGRHLGIWRRFHALHALGDGSDRMDAAMAMALG
jgi:hypothetical protein